MFDPQDITKLSAEVAVLRSRSENQQREIDEIKKSMDNYVTYDEFNTFKAAVLLNLDEGKQLLKRLMVGQERLKDIFIAEKGKEEGKKQLIQEQEEEKKRRQEENTIFWKKIIRWFVISSSVATCIGAFGGITFFEKIKSLLGW